MPIAFVSELVSAAPLNMVARFKDRNSNSSGRIAAASHISESYIGGRILVFHKKEANARIHPFYDPNE